MHYLDHLSQMIKSGQVTCLVTNSVLWRLRVLATGWVFTTTRRISHLSPPLRGNLCTLNYVLRFRCIIDTSVHVSRLR
jgi:hypothetical protein